MVAQRKSGEQRVLGREVPAEGEPGDDPEVGRPVAPDVLVAGPEPVGPDRQRARPEQGPADDQQPDERGGPRVEPPAQVAESLAERDVRSAATAATPRPEGEEHGDDGAGDGDAEHDRRVEPEQRGGGNDRERAGDDAEHGAVREALERRQEPGEPVQRGDPRRCERAEEEQREEHRQDGHERHDRGVTAATILHVDLDAFFAAVEQRDRPELRGRPVIVGGDPGARGVVSAASYEARRFGVHSAMPLRTAAALCPEGVFLPVNGSRYRTASRAVMEILGRYTPRVEQVSIDEAFLDVAGSEALFGPPPAIAAAIKATIRAEVGLTASVGVATTKLVAKIASDLRKPDGLVVVAVGDEAAFLAPLPIARLWGVGAQTRAALAEYGVRTIGDLASIDPQLLVRRLGKHGATLVERARGVDPSPVTGDAEAKSVSHEHTFDVDTSDQEEIERTLLALAEGVATRLRAGGVQAADRSR